MTYFIHKTASGTQPQAGYERLSVYRNTVTLAIWVLWRADKTEAEIRDTITGDLYVIGADSDANVLSVYPDLLLQKRSRIRSTGATMLTNIAGEYMPEERETWTEQKAQAEAYLANNSADVPMLQAFADARGIPISLLAQGVSENNALFQVASGQVLGAMYALLDQVNAAPNLQAALEIEWS
ncbi:MAG: hypothetical protein PF440_09740 [Thiomicrorhabdus sp.]|jgi:hypothetical protein|nr:hypothetical protein [Thiomicrorhabdus sp.]